MPLKSIYSPIETIKKLTRYKHVNWHNTCASGGRKAGIQKITVIAWPFSKELCKGGIGNVISNEGTGLMEFNTVPYICYRAMLDGSSDWFIVGNQSKQDIY